MSGEKKRVPGVHYGWVKAGTVAGRIAAGGSLVTQKDADAAVAYLREQLKAATAAFDAKMLDKVEALRNRENLLRTVLRCRDFAELEYLKPKIRHALGAPKEPDDGPDQGDYMGHPGVVFHDEPAKQEWPAYPDGQSLAEQVRDIMADDGYGEPFSWNDHRAEVIDALVRGPFPCAEEPAKQPPACGCGGEPDCGERHVVVEPAKQPLPYLLTGETPADAYARMTAKQPPADDEERDDMWAGIVTALTGSTPEEWSGEPGDLAMARHWFDRARQPTPAAAAREQAFYVQDCRSYVGNSMLWWAKDAKGYVCDIRKAHRFTLEELGGISRETDRVWPARLIDEHAAHHIDCQPVNRLRSESIRGDRVAAFLEAEQEQGRCDATALGSRCLKDAGHDGDCVMNMLKRDQPRAGKETGE